MLQQLVAQRGNYGPPPPSTFKGPCEGGPQAPKDLPAERPSAPRVVHGPRAPGSFSGLPQERHHRAPLAGAAVASHRHHWPSPGCSPPRPVASIRSTAGPSAGCCVPSGPPPACYVPPRSARAGCTPSRAKASVAQGATTTGRSHQAPESRTRTTSARPKVLRGGAPVTRGPSVGFLSGRFRGLPQGRHQPASPTASPVGAAADAGP